MRIFSKSDRKISASITSVPVIGRLVLAIGILFGGFLGGSVLYQQGIYHEVKYIFQGRFDELKDGTIKDTIFEVVALIRDESSAYQGNDLSTLYLDIPFENIQIIQQKRDEALKTGILLASDADFVPATVRYNDSAPINTKIRLKGDWTDHLEGDKWSYRIHILDDGAVEGMQRFSIQAPETRAFVYEWAYHRSLMREELLAPRYFFVNVIMNGENKGVYAMEESFATELMESQNRRAGVILRYDETDMWENWAPFFAEGMEDMRTAAGASGYFMVSDYSSSNISVFGQGNIVTDPVLFREYKAAQSLLRSYQLGELPAYEVFDMQQMGKFLAVTELWGAGHALAWHNLRFYYDPVTNLLEPIGFDGLPMIEPFATIDINNLTEEDFLLNDLTILQAFSVAAEDVIEDGYLENLEKELTTDIEIYVSALNKNYNVDTHIDWDRVYLQRDNLREQLN